MVRGPGRVWSAWLPTLSTSGINRHQTYPLCQAWTPTVGLLTLALTFSWGHTWQMGTYFQGGLGWESAVGGRGPTAMAEASAAHRPQERECEVGLRGMEGLTGHVRHWGGSVLPSSCQFAFLEGRADVGDAWWDLTREAAACGGAVEGTGPGLRGSPVPPLPVTIRRDLGPNFIPIPRGG